MPKSIYSTTTVKNLTVNEGGELILPNDFIADKNFEVVTKAYVDQQVGGTASEMNDLSDVTLSSVTNNQILRYDTGGSIWQNESPSWDASEITSGTFANARISESSVTQHESAITHQNISGAGSNTHTQIDTHISSSTGHGTSSNIVGISDSQTLTNKSIDADNNTITNIDNSDIKSGAAINATKLADGSVSNTEFQFINSLDSNAQDQIDTITQKTDLMTIISDEGNLDGPLDTIDEGGTYNRITIDAVNKILYTTSGTSNNTIRSYDIGDPANLNVALDIQSPGASVNGLSYKNGYLLASCAGAGLFIYSVTFDGIMTLEDSIDDGGTYRRCYLSDSTDFALVCAGGAGLYSYDTSTKTAIALLDNIDDSASEYRGIYVDEANNRCYCNCGSEFIIYDISNLSSLSLVSQTSVTGTGEGIWADFGQYVYVNRSGGGLHIYDISNEASPTFVSTDDQGGSYVGIWKSSNYLYIGASSANILTYNVSVPTAPAFLGSFGSGSARQLQRATIDVTDYVFCAEGGDGLASYSLAENVSFNKVTITSTQGDSLDVAGSVIIQGTLFTDQVSRSSAGVLALGNGASTSVEISESTEDTTILGPLNCNEGLDVTGNITVSGTVDGRDVATDGTNQDSHIAASSNVHGVTSNVIGSTDTQTMSNKTLLLPKIDTIHEEGNGGAILDFQNGGVTPENYFSMTNAINSSDPIFETVGTGNVGMDVRTQGTGEFSFKIGSTERLNISDTLIDTDRQLSCQAGSATNPSVYFGSNSNTGIFNNNGDNKIKFTSNGSKVCEVDEDIFRLDTGAQLELDAGAALTPAIIFTAYGNDLGIYASLNQINFVAGGSLRASITNTDAMELRNDLAFLGNGVVKGLSGSNSAPTYTFTDQQDLGMYRSATDTLAFSTAGSRAMRINSGQQVVFEDGSETLPSITFGDNSIGIWRSATTLRFSCNAGECFRLNGNQQVVLRSDGTNLLPSLTFENDGNTGLYSSTGDTMEFTCAGTDRISINPAGFHTTAVHRDIQRDNSNTTLPALGDDSHIYIWTASTPILCTVTLPEDSENGREIIAYNRSNGGTMTITTSDTSSIDGDASHGENEGAKFIYHSNTDTWYSMRWV